MSVYNYEVKDRDGVKVSLKDYQGKVLLIVNTATECGFTPQYDDLQDLYELYGNDGFEVLDFPCNQFGNQAPGTSSEIYEFCSSRFGVSFKIFDKVNVVGDDAHPLFSYLTSEKGFDDFNMDHPVAQPLKDALENLNPDFASSDDIKWNFTKFLVDRNGQVIERFEPTTFPEEIEDAVKGVL